MKRLKIFFLICLIVLILLATSFGCQIFSYKGALEEKTKTTGNKYFNYPVRDYPIGKTESTRLYWDCSDNDFGHYLGKYDELKYDGYHPGEDWNLKGGKDGEIDKGLPVYSIGEGKVIKISDLGSLGNLVIVEHDGNFSIPSKEINSNGQKANYDKEAVDRIYSVYLHITNLKVKENEAVDENTILGYIMNPGGGSHLHFEIRKNNDNHDSSWSLIGDSTNWQRFPGDGYNGYYKELQKMIDSGLRDPSDFIEANMISNKVIINSPKTIPVESTTVVSSTIAEETFSETSVLKTENKEHPWPMLYHDPKFTKRSSYEGPSNPVEMWQLKFKSIISNPVVDYNGTIYIIAVEDNKILLFAVESNGKIKWRCNLNKTNETVDFERCQCYLALEQDDLIILSSSWGLTGISTDGTIVWTLNIGDCNYRCPIVDKNGDIFIVTNAKNSIEYEDDILYCISKDGFINWQVDLKKYYSYNDFAVGSPDLILNNNSIYIGNGFTKIELQNNNISDNEPFFLNYSDSAIGYQNRIIFPCWESSLIYFMDFPSFNQIWDFNAQGFVFRPSIAADGTVYFNAYNYDNASAPSYLYSAKKDGGLNWSLELPSSVFPQMTVDSEGIVYLSVNHRIYAIYPDSSVKWVYEFLSDSGADQPIIGINNMLYFITGIWNGNSTLHAIGNKG